MRACIALPPENHMALEHKLPKSLFINKVSADKIGEKIKETCFITPELEKTHKVVA